jgi:hypothetical protein
MTTANGCGSVKMIQRIDGCEWDWETLRMMTDWTTMWNSEFSFTVVIQNHSQWIFMSLALIRSQAFPAVYTCHSQSILHMCSHHWQSSFTTVTSHGLHLLPSFTSSSTVTIRSHHSAWALYHDDCEWWQCMMWRRMTANDSEWRRMTANNIEGGRMTVSDSCEWCLGMMTLNDDCECRLCVSDDYEWQLWMMT